MTSSIAGAAIGGIQSGMRDFDQAATRVARSGTTTPDSSPVDGLLAARQAKLQVQASAKVLAAADQNIGTILDIVA
jgi:hypothetical protein